MAQVTYRGVKYDTADSKTCQKQVSELTYRGIKHTEEKVVCAKWVTDLQTLKSRVLTLLFFCTIISWKAILMNKSKLKVLVMALKEIVEELESEVYSDVDAYKQENYQEHVGSMADYDEVFEDDEWL